jgi:hypothetical protein
VHINIGTCTPSVNTPSIDAGFGADPRAIVNKERRETTREKQTDRHRRLVVLHGQTSLFLTRCMVGRNGCCRHGHEPSSVLGVHGPVGGIVGRLCETSIRRGQPRTTGNLLPRCRNSDGDRASVRTTHGEKPSAKSSPTDSLQPSLGVAPIGSRNRSSGRGCWALRQWRRRGQRRYRAPLPSFPTGDRRRCTDHG